MIALSIALVLVALVAHDAWRRTLAARTAETERDRQAAAAIAAIADLRKAVTAHEAFMQAGADALARADELARKVSTLEQNERLREGRR